MGGRAWEGVALMLSERLLGCVMEWREGSSRLMWVKTKIGWEVWVFVRAYGPGREKGEEERDKFWLSECVNDF
jgi:hypothetical protein